MVRELVENGRLRKDKGSIFEHAPEYQQLYDEMGWGMVLVSMWFYYWPTDFAAEKVAADAANRPRDEFPA